MNPTQRASEWIALMREQEPTVQERQAFCDWLTESPAHMREYLEMARTWGYLNSPSVWPTDSKEEILERLQKSQGRNVVSLMAAPSAKAAAAGLAAEGKRWLRHWKPLAAALAVIAMAATVLVTRAHTYAMTYKTGRGEQRSVVLSDGSVIQLNTLSTLMVHFSASQRRMELARGEGFFRVARDSTRPFSVVTPFLTINAVGTEFNVYNHGNGTQVAVVEGKVYTVPRHLTGGVRPVYLNAGEAITVTPTARAAPAEVNRSRATAWMQRRIMLDNDTIATAAEEFNRYNRLQLKIDNPEIAALRINGAFDADKPRALVKYLQEAQGVQVREESERITLSR